MRDKIVNTKRKAFVLPLFKYCIAAACMIEVGSLLFIGWDTFFAYGLALGTCVSITNYSLLVSTAKIALWKGRGASLAVIGYILRLTVYGGTFLLSYNTGTVSGIAVLFGFMTVKLAIFYMYGFKPGFASRKYEKAELNDLDQDQWAAEAAERAGRPRRLRKIMREE